MIHWLKHSYIGCTWGYGHFQHLQNNAYLLSNITKNKVLSTTSGTSTYPFDIFHWVLNIQTCSHSNPCSFCTLCLLWYSRCLWNNLLKHFILHKSCIFQTDGTMMKRLWQSVIPWIVILGHKQIRSLTLFGGYICFWAVF